MRIIVITPHPDDETLGCGGTLFRQKAEKNEIYWLIVTGISEETGWPKKVVKKREAEINSVANIYGFTEVFQLRLPTTRIDSLPVSDMIEKITEVYKKVEPEIIYMPYAYDVHTDHQIIAKVVQSTLKWFRHPYLHKILMYETPSETEFNFVENRNFNPNIFIDISNFLDDKIKVMKIYQKEISEHPFPRSEKNMRALATFRGSQSGFQAAEAFELVYERK